MEFPAFSSSQKYLPDKCNVLLLGTGPSIIYNYNILIEYIKKNNPIIIGINGFLKGIYDVCAIDNLHSEYHRSDVDKNLFPHKINSPIIPNIMFSNYLLQGEKCYPDGTEVPNKKRGDRYSPSLTENYSDNLFCCNFLSQKNNIIDNQIYVQCPNNPTKIIDGKHLRLYYGNIQHWQYDRSKRFDIFPSPGSFNIYDLSKQKSLRLEDLFNDTGIRFSVLHGGEYLLSWIAYNQPNTIAICGLYDQFKQNSKTLIRNWFWCNPKRILPKNIIPSQRIIIDLFKKEYGTGFVDLNLQDKK